MIRPYRIAQCRSIKISFKSDEPIPVQVDGEAWLQSPCVIKITHKTRTQMLSRDKAFLNMLRSWEEKQSIKNQMKRARSATTDAIGLMTADERSVLTPLAQATLSLVAHLRVCITELSTLEKDILPILIAVEAAYEKLTGESIIGTSATASAASAATVATSAPTTAALSTTASSTSTASSTNTTTVTAAVALSSSSSSSGFTGAVLNSEEPGHQPFLRRYMMDFTKHVKNLIQESRWLVDMRKEETASLGSDTMEGLVSRLKVVEIEMKRVVDMQSSVVTQQNSSATPSSISSQDSNSANNLLVSQSEDGATRRGSSFSDAPAGVLGEPMVEAGNTSPKSTKRGSFTNSNFMVGFLFI